MEPNIRNQNRGVPLRRPEKELKMLEDEHRILNERFQRIQAEMKSVDPETITMDEASDIYYDQIAVIGMEEEIIRRRCRLDLAEKREPNVL